MNRKSIVALAILLLIGLPVLSAHAQSDEPPPQTTVHVVQQGETIFSIAQRYGSTVDAITHANGIPDPRQTYAGQSLLIPGAKGDTSTTGTVSHVVRAGDTLASIAKYYHTTWQTLARVNDLLTPNAVYAGQIIQIPVPSDLAEAASEEGIARAPVGGGVSYIVRSDDTLFRIALRYGISPWTLATTSHVANPALIYPGQELVVPGEGPGLLPAPFAFIEVQPLPVTQGTSMIISVHATEPIVLTGRLFEREVFFAEEGGTYHGLVGVHVFSEPGLYELELTATDSQGQNTTVSTGIVVEAGRFSYERIDVPYGRTNLLDPATIANDRERLDAVRYVFTSERLWTLPFQRPCPGSISAYYGAHRSYNGGPYTSYHSGTDFRAPGGTPVHASAAGTVVLAEPLALWGNGIVIDHGWGVLTGYGHLSEIGVQPGQTVAQGDVIGKVGNTGLSTGAHLHWEMWVGGISVNGLQWLEGPSPWPEIEWLAVGG